MFSSESCVFTNEQHINEIPCGSLYGLNKFGFTQLVNFPNFI